MPHSQTFEAIVLKTYDVGEADRFCVFFTRERGKIAARARGVRKPLSRKGGTLLAPHHIRVSIVESAAGNLITDASHVADHRTIELHPYLAVQQGIELLLAVLHDEEPMPDVFDALSMFLRVSRDAPCANVILPFTLRLLMLLGLFPAPEAKRIAQFSETAKKYIDMSCRNQWHNLPELSAHEKARLEILFAELLEDHTTRPLRAGAIAAQVFTL